MKIKIFSWSLFLFFMLLGASFLLVGTAFGGGINVPTNTGLPYPNDHTGGAGPVIDVIFYFVGWILSVFMLMAVLAFVITGIQYLMAFGDTYKAETAKKNFTYSVIAVAIVGGSLIIIRTLDWLLEH